MREEHREEGTALQTLPGVVAESVELELRWALGGAAADPRAVCFIIAEYYTPAHLVPYSKCS